MARQCFLFFSMKLDSHKVRKVAKPDLWQKVPSGQGNPRNSIKWLKNKVLGFWQKSNRVIWTFFTRMCNYLWSSTFLQKPHVQEKSSSCYVQIHQSKCMIYAQANYICTQANYIYTSELVRRALSSTTFSNHICHWLIELLMGFLSVSPMHLILLLKAFQCAHIALHSCRPSFQ